MRPDCYKYKYRGKVPGSAHSCCNHPSVKESKNPESELLAILAGVGRVKPVMNNSSVLNIKADPHGIKKGGFNFPWSFDSVWLENCDGFEPKER